MSKAAPNSTPAFRTLKQDLGIRPIHYQLDPRVRAHVLVCFLAYAPYRTLDRSVEASGLGLSARKVLSTLSTIQSGDILLPPTEARELRLPRFSRPNTQQAEQLARLGLTLPEA